MSLSINFSKKTIVFITGASRGIGKTIGIELARRFDLNSIFVLLARSVNGLNETKKAIHELDKSINVLTYETDLSKPDLGVYNELFKDVLSKIDTTGIEFGLFIHNAGITGELKNTTELTDIKIWREYFDLNLFSVSLLNSVFIKQMRPVAPQLGVVNITSACGRIPFQNFGMYGAGKAARELFFKVFAVEEPNVIVLNYSPGPVDTDMLSGVIESASSDAVRKTFSDLKLLTTEQTVTKFLDILEKGDYKSGDTIDYYDRE